ncbi:MAG TPA: hypothetical protein VKI65_14745 [Gemmataceae bacterium]|nr:hypothetical protein [Gemmataceae bacterium]
MPRNHLEDLVAEWYEFRGYFVRRNVAVGKRPNGGWECELDVVAFHPKQHHLVQIEPSLDALSWEKREVRYKRKFDAGRKYIPTLFPGMAIPDDIEQIAVLVFASTTTHKTLGGGRVQLIGELMQEIFAGLKGKRIASNAVPEHLPILRSFQFVVEYWKMVCLGLGAAWEKKPLTSKLCGPTT